VSLTVQSPVSGVVVALSDVPDPVFSGKIVGPGVAVVAAGMHAAGVAGVVAEGVGFHAVGTRLQVGTVYC